MNGESLLRHDGVMNQPCEIDRSHRDAAHIGVPQDVVQVVPGIASGDDWLKHIQPAREPGVVLAFFFEDQMGDLVRVQLFTFGEGAGRTPADLFNQRGEMVSDDNLSQSFMGQAESMEKIVVEEVAEGPVSDVVHQGRDAQELLNIIGRGHVFDGLFQKGVQVSSKSSGHMHGP